MRRSVRLSAVLGALAVGWPGCGGLRGAPDYYEGVWDPPSLASLSRSGEVGNVGGAEVELSGEGFGVDPDEVLVIFGDHNAEILSMEDSRLRVKVPPGPLSGGAVDVRVATGTGFALLGGGYTYDVGRISDGESAYVQVNNYWESCLGGLSSRLDDAYGSLLGGLCETIVYNGVAGIGGSSAGYSFVYPRIHAPAVGYYSSGDLAGADWVVERPGALSFPSGVDDLHEDIGPVTLHNPFFAGDGEDAIWCADLGALAGYRYGGGAEEAPAPATVYPADPYVVGGHAGACTEEEDTGVGRHVAYDMTQLRFCTTTDGAGAPGHVYEADWPVVENFFMANRRNPKPVEVTVDIPDVGVLGQPLVLPESILVRAGQGFEALSDDEEANADLWALGELSGCFDDDGNGEQLDDVAITFSWTPSTADLPSAGTGAVSDSITWVRVSITEIAYNWLGPMSYPVRATVTVPDDLGYSAETGLSTIEIPASVLYQFPTVRFPDDAGGALLDPGTGDWGFLMVTVDRVTEYTLTPPLGGEIVFAYATGDIGVFSWTNPVDAAACPPQEGQ